MIQIGLKETTCKASADILHTYLATEIALNLKIRNYHWNVEGGNFKELHELFEDLYKNGAEYVDEIAERIRMLGVHTHASMKKYIDMTLIEEESDVKKPSNDMLKQLLDDNEKIIVQMRKDIRTLEENGDAGNTDFLTALLQKHEKDAWFLRSTRIK